MPLPRRRTGAQPWRLEVFAMSAQHEDRAAMTRPRADESPPAWATARGAVGCFFLVTGGVHLGMVATDSEVYRHFADGSPVPFVREAWTDIFMAHPATWGLLVMTAEVVMGLLLLSGGVAAKAGWVGVIAFNVALMLFGWGFWLWSVPVLAFLIWAARRDWPSLSAPASLRPVPAA